MSPTTLTARVRALPCFQHVRWKPDRAELRSFAYWMLGGFAVLGTIAAWRTGGLGAAPLALWAIGVVLAASTLIPPAGRVAYVVVYALSGVMGYLVSRVVLTAIFYLVFTPIGVALRVSGRDLLQGRRRKGRSTWLEYGPPRAPDSYYRQF